MARSAVERRSRSAEQIVDLMDYDKVVRGVIANSTAMEGDLRDHGTVGQILEGMQEVAVQALAALVDIDVEDKLEIMRLQLMIQIYRETANRAYAIIQEAGNLQDEDAANQMIEDE